MQLFILGLAAAAAIGYFATTKKDTLRPKPGERWKLHGVVKGPLVKPGASAISLGVVRTTVSTVLGGFVSNIGMAPDGTFTLTYLTGPASVPIQVGKTFQVGDTKVTITRAKKV